MNFNLNKIVKEWSYRVHDGMPDIKDPLHMVELQQVLYERKYPRKFIETLLNRLREEQRKFGDIWQTDSGKWAGLKRGEDSPEYGMDSKEAAQTYVHGQEVPDKKEKEKGTEEPEGSEASKKAVEYKKEKKERQEAIQRQQATARQALEATDLSPETIESMVKGMYRDSIKGHFTKDMMEQNNVSNKTFSNRDASNEVLGILSANDDLEKFDNYDRPSFEALGKSGNLVDTFKKSGMSYESIQQLLSMAGKESGRGVGKMEVGLATLVGDVKMAAAGAGDLDWGGKYLEVKGSAARLGGRDRVFPGDFNNSALGQLATQFNVPRNIVTGSEGRQIDKTMMVSLISGIANHPDVDLNEVREAVIEFERVAHPNGNGEKYFTEDVLKDPVKLRKALAKNLVANYVADHGVEHLIFGNTNELLKKKDKPWADGSGEKIVDDDGKVYYTKPNPKFGSFFSFTPEEADSLIENGDIRFGNVGLHNLDPSIGKP